MIDAVNVIACAVMLVFAAVVAIEMPHRGMWARRLTLWAVAVGLACQIAAPWSGGALPPVTWASSMLHALLAVVMLAWRAELLALLRAKIGAVSPDLSPRQLRRTTDWAEGPKA